jgi:hypothetical protein
VQVPVRAHANSRLGTSTDPRRTFFFFLESTFIDQNNPKRQTAGPRRGSPKLDLTANLRVLRTLGETRRGARVRAPSSTPPS